MTAITALTAQNTQGVYATHEIPIEFLICQMRVVLEDIGVDCIKTGMLHNTGTIKAISETLNLLARDVDLVVDPVMVAKGGQRLLDISALDVLKSEMFPKATLVTPNIPEAELLTGRKIFDVETMRVAANDLIELGSKAVLIKGGHLKDENLTDVLVTEKGQKCFVGPRLISRHTHGTGCSMASAIATGLGQGLNLDEAISRARDFVFTAIKTAPGFGHGHGPLNHAHTIKPF